MIDSNNLREVHREFKERFPDCKVGFSKFAALRPEHCVLAGASGTHSVCVCTIHQNIKLMSFEMQIPELPTYHHCLAKIMCNPPHARCYFGECDVYQLFTLGIVATKIMQRNGSSSLERRFQLSHTISGTRKLHSFVPISNRTVEVRHYSASDASRKERVTLAKKWHSLESIAGFVTCLYEGNPWLACVLEVCSDTKKVKLTFLHPQGPSNLFKSPEARNIHNIPMDDILTLVDPRTRSGRVYSQVDKKRNDFFYRKAQCHHSKILYYI